MMHDSIPWEWEHSDDPDVLDAWAARYPGHGTYWFVGWTRQLTFEPEDEGTDWVTWHGIRGNMPGAAGPSVRGHLSKANANDAALRGGPMKLFLDTEFVEDGVLIIPLSIGVVREDGAEYYTEVFPADQLDVNDWVAANVVPHLTGPEACKPVHEVAADLIEFAGPNPEWWAYYADYDWVLLCQLFGRMIDLPKGWPMFCMDLKQLAVERGNPQLPEQTTTEHHALADARWVRDTWLWLQDPGAGYVILAEDYPYSDGPPPEPEWTIDDINPPA